jgi:hypothetical protein
MSTIYVIKSARIGKIHDLRAARHKERDRAGFAAAVFGEAGQAAQMTPIGAVQNH